MDSKIIHRLRTFLSFYREADTLYQVHSPHAYQWAEAVLKNESQSPEMKEVERLRSEFLHNTTVLGGPEPGAGHTGSRNSRSVGDFAARAVSPPGRCRRLYRLLRRTRAKTVLELGTGLGISTLYMAFGAPDARIYTLEGHPQLHRLACEGFNRSGMSNIQSIQGSFGTSLPGLLTSIPAVDFAFIDGDHRHAATVEYTRLIRANLSEQGLILIDDIHWSADMTAAWNELRAEAEISIDFYSWGLLCYYPFSSYRQAYRLIQSSWKPWKVAGFY